MDLFLPIFTQMLVLFAFIAIGFLLAKFKVVPANANAVLSKLENFIFVPALVMGTFITNCTTENISTLWKVLLFSVILLVVLMLLSFLAAKAVGAIFSRSRANFCFASLGLTSELGKL